ncbi:hypothetical protein K0B03_03540 [Patescibacteria group bacterium]|nr:hypothetical protein [Patescibacteria group bacterium]
MLIVLLQGGIFLKDNKYKSFVDQFNNMFSTISENFVRGKRTRIRDETTRILQFVAKEERNKEIIINTLWLVTNDIYKKDQIDITITEDQIRKLVERHFK